MQDHTISLKSVTREYGRQRGRVLGVEDVSMDVRAGEVTCLLGPNGAGKTTLMSLLGLMTLPSGGEIYFGTINAVTARGVERQALQRRIAFVPETPFVYNLLTGREFVSFVAELYQVERGVAATRLVSLLDAFELGPAADRLIRTYSQGMLKKIALASALVHAPDVLLLDEPTNGLDPLASSTLERLLQEERARGVAIVISTHSLDVADRLGDAIVILNRGRVAHVERYPADARPAERQLRSRVERLYYQVTDHQREDPCARS